ncbi:MAG: hypothetical protein AB7L13_19915 [Acidimicrobiia bacterium]
MERWGLVVRVSVVCSLMTAALGVALYQFWGVSRTWLVLAAAVEGLAIGLRLPAVKPAPTAARIAAVPS